jgi:hypothetical protein
MAYSGDPDQPCAPSPIPVTDDDTTAVGNVGYPEDDPIVYALNYWAHKF